MRAIRRDLLASVIGAVVFTVLVGLASPLIVTGLPTGRVAPAAGELIAVVGAVVSVEAVAAVRPVSRVSGWTPMSANRLIVACWAAVSGAADPRS